MGSFRWKFIGIFIYLFSVSVIVVYKNKKAFIDADYSTMKADRPACVNLKVWISYLGYHRKRAALSIVIKVIKESFHSLDYSFLVILRKEYTSLHNLSIEFEELNVYLNRCFKMKNYLHHLMKSGKISEKK